MKKNNNNIVLDSVGEGIATHMNNERLKECFKEVNLPFTEENLKLFFQGWNEMMASTRTKLSNYAKHYQAIRESGRSIVETETLQKVRESAHQILKEYAPHRFENAPQYMSDFYMQVKHLSTSIDILNIDAGLVTCSIPGCTNSADVPTTLGNIQFCYSCFEEQQEKNCGE